MFRSLIAVTLAVLSITASSAAPAPAAGQDRQIDNSQAESGQPPQRIRNVTLVGKEACPKPEAGEVVVCDRLSGDEQFRVPKELRESKADAATQSWVNRAATIDEVGRVAGGLPNTCSPVGSGGQTGCTTKLLRDYTADKVDRKRRQRAIP